MTDVARTHYNRLLLEIKQAEREAIILGYPDEIILKLPQDQLNRIKFLIKNRIEEINQQQLKRPNMGA